MKAHRFENVISRLIGAPESGRVGARLGLGGTMQESLDVHNDTRYDGMLVGVDGDTFTAETLLEDVPAIAPKNGKAVNGSIVWVNGIMTDLALQHADMQSVADKQGVRVVGIHNSTEGMAGDLKQCLTDKMGLERNTAIATAETLIAQALAEDEPLHLVGHSQGALILSNALKNVDDSLAQQSYGKKERANLLSSIEVTTLGGAGAGWVDGPEYHHYINRADSVPMLTGVGLDKLNPFAGPGAGADIHAFTEVHKPQDLPKWEEGATNRLARMVDKSVHGPRDVYLKHWNLTS